MFVGRIIGNIFWAMNDNKRTVKIKFVDYWGTFPEELEDYLSYKILKKYYNVEICEDADYVFFATMGERHWGIPDTCVKIFQTGENLAPDFNACDYAIGFEWMDYEDRYIRFPTYLYYDIDMLYKMETKHLISDEWSVDKEKKGFCSYTVSNHRNEKRNATFWKLMEYKKVDSGGRYMNNIGGPVKDKFEFEKQHKFTICFENGLHNGYTTEKLVQSLAAQTIPIYWGDPLVGKVFNTKAFINANDYDSIEDVIARVKEIDEDDELYKSIIREPALLPTALSVDEEIQRYEKWLLHIFEQPLEQAYRRNREMQGRWYIERRLKLSIKDNWKEILQLKLSLFRKALRHIKRKYFHGK